MVSISDIILQSRSLPLGEIMDDDGVIIQHRRAGRRGYLVVPAMGGMVLPEKARLYIRETGCVSGEDDAVPSPYGEGPLYLYYRWWDIQHALLGARGSSLCGEEVGEKVVVWANNYDLAEPDVGLLLEVKKHEHRTNGLPVWQPTMVGYAHRTGRTLSQPWSKGKWEVVEIPRGTGISFQGFYGPRVD